MTIYTPMAVYAHRPAPTGLHAKLLRELSERSPYRIMPQRGVPNHIYVIGPGDDTLIGPGPRVCLWRGHRDLMPASYRGAHDPYNLLTRPASD